MKITFRAFAPFSAALVLALCNVGCSGDGEDATDDSQAQAAVVRNYAELVSANYVDALASAKELDKAVQAFTANPSEATLEAAKEAWLASRDPYGLSEAYRFYQGPIDNDDSDDDIEEGPEGLLNSWPLDESYIDYVVGPNDTIVSSGIINLVDDFPTIDADVLSDANGAASDTSVSTGYHAVEFLLWGQDLSTEGPGARPYTDYVTGDDATAENADRRAEYLDVVSDLIVTNLSTVNDAWADGEANYRADFLKLPPKDALGKIMLGMGSLSGAELSGERMNVAYENQEQEDEHSCFSDNTLKDLHNNATSVQNVLLGRYGDLDGPGIDELVEAKDPVLAKQLREQIQGAIDNIDAVKGTFDNAIIGDDSNADRKKIAAAILALQTFTESVKKAADELGIELRFDE
jgi:putative iron-regulated protein